MALNLHIYDQSKICKKLCTNDFKDCSNRPIFSPVPKPGKKFAKASTETDPVHRQQLPSVTKPGPRFSSWLDLSSEAEGDKLLQTLYKSNLKHVGLTSFKGKHSRNNKSNLPYLNHKRYKYNQFIIEEQDDEENDDGSNQQPKASLTASPSRKRHESALVIKIS